MLPIAATHLAGSCRLLHGLFSNQRPDSQVSRDRWGVDGRIDELEIEEGLSIGHDELVATELRYRYGVWGVIVSNECRADQMWTLVCWLSN